MKKLFTLLFLALSLTGTARVFYLSPSGNDNNTGTINTPWFTLNKAWTIIAAGDTVYLRGGTFAYNSQQYLTGINGTAANLVKIWAYPGEIPIFTDSGTYPTNGQDLIFFQGNYFHWKGLEISYVTRDVSYAAFRTEACSNSIFELINYHHNKLGFSLRGQNGPTTNNLILNCDFHHNEDPALDNADGINITYNSTTSSVNTVRGCRAYYNSDDGFDGWANDGKIIFENCWAWKNGFKEDGSIAGDGGGFKFGQSVVVSATVRRVAQNCVSWGNRKWGFTENDFRAGVQMFNNTAVNNGVWNFWFGDWANNQMTARNNIQYQGGSSPYYVFNSTNTTSDHNTWQGGIVVNNADFVNMDDTQLILPRQADGSLPVITFLHLATGSDMINAGTNVGLPYTGTAPDIGAFETGGAVGNQPPTANAGTNKNITLPTSSITQTGSGTDPDGTISAYQWTKIAGPAQFTIVSPTQAQTVINNLVQGVYQFELRVTDNLGATDTDTMTVTVNPVATNQPPTANAGTNKNITLPTSSITQTGSGTDPDGTISAYQWTKIAGPAQFTIVSPTQAQTIINNLVQGVYQFELRVTDNLGATDTDTMTVTVNPVAANQSPTANAGANKNITLPVSSITQTGSGTDPDGTISAYQWTKIAGPAQFTIVSPTQAQTIINNLVQGVYQFELRVTDNLGATDTDTMQVTVNPVAANQSPTANAGTNKNITLPTSSITQTGSGTDPDGTISAYQWTKIAGPAQFTIVSPTQAQTVINNLAQGVYQFELRVTDNLGATDTDTMTVTVNPVATNQPPTANAGTNKNITLPTSSITQTGSGTDPDGTISAYQWTKIAGPAQFTIVSPTQAQTIINNLVQGVYQFELRVTDNLGATDTDTMTVTVNPVAANQSPTANAGANKNITLPVSSITQTGSGTDPDGTISAYQWTKIAGPAQFTIVSPTQAQTIINNLVQGVYQFELRVTDNLGATDTDTMTVTVNPVAANQSPTANAGANKNITLPVSSITQTGSGTDPDGTISAYQWTKIAGPAQFTIVSPTQAQTIINNLVQGVYQFELRVTDNLGATDTDTMTVTVNPVAANQSPTANAGTNKNITLPTSSITQTGSGTDPDGTISAYQWTKIAGPAQFTIVSPTQAQTIINNLVQGVYQFELRVTDNLGATDTDTMTVTVNPATSTNQPPVADAGADQTITLPANSITQAGTGTDPDGTIAAYLWRKIAGPIQFTIVSPTLPLTEFVNLELGLYQFELTVTDNLGTIGKDTVTIEIIQATSLITQGYPNPVTDKINIRLNPSKDPGGFLKIKLFDSRGIAILEEQVSTSQTSIVKQIDMSKYPTGFYLIEVISAENKREIMKIVKQ